MAADQKQVSLSRAHLGRCEGLCHCSSRGRARRQSFVVDGETDFTRSYQKLGSFWLPESNESETKVRILGSAVLTIKYREYQITQTHTLTPAFDVVEKASNGQ